MCEGNNPKCRKKISRCKDIYCSIFHKEKYWKQAKYSIMEGWLKL